MAWNSGLAAAFETAAAEKELRGRWGLYLLALVIFSLAASLGLRVQGLAAQRQAQVRLWNEARTKPGFINLNLASEQSLQALPGVGPAMAARIRAWRERVGPFRSPDDLSRVPGIGNNRQERLRSLVTTEQ